ncbi:DNA internalization-related competence protein ComEC/Rec2 [Paenibacillus sp. TAB 01]|uniref:DNA internalization-related competence protein ComEC/Rec2 n=1 Tax=Paenibacillus sp. TAB 01 TaxID=3368988 RepID=UPI0037528051
MRSRPVVAVTLLWTAGYALAAGAELSILSYVTSLALAAAACIVWIFPFPGHKLLCGLLVILVAAGYYEAYDRGNQSHFIAAGGQSEDAVTETSISLEGVIVSPVEVDGDKAAFILASAAVDGERFAVNVKLLTQGEQETARRWQRSDLVSLQGSAKLPEEARNFGGFDYRGYLKLQHIHWQISVKGAESISVRPPVSWTLERVLRWNDQLRDRLGQCVEQLFPALQSGFMKGMLVGLTDDLNPLQFQQFSQLGLTHIIAISGLNVTIFLGCLIWLMRRLGFTRETYLITAILLMPLYIAVTGASPSIIRAGLMAMVALYAAYRHALKDGLHIVLLVGMAMLVWEPYYLLDVSFQLSFLVTIGLILGVPHVSRMLPIRSRAWRDAVSIAVVAQAVSFPVSIYYFNQFSLLSLAANLCLVPLFSMAVMPAGTAAMLLGLIYLPAGKVIAWPVTWLNEWIFAIVETASRWGVFQTIWRTPGFGWMFCYYGGAVFLLYGVHLYKQSFIPPEAGPMLQIGFSAAPQEQAKKWMPLKSAVLLSAAMLWMILLLFWGYDAERRGGQGEVDFIDVGQGDSILIRSPVSNSILLIDGGGTVTFGKPGDDWKKRKDPYEVGRKLLVPLLKKRGIQQIDYLVISHQDADHIGGLQAVLEQIPVREVVFNGHLQARGSRGKAVSNGACPRRSTGKGVLRR